MDKKYRYLRKAQTARWRKRLNGRFYSLKANAKSRDKLLEISFEQFCELVSHPCTYCGESEKRIGVDRVDNAGGYTIENCVPCCERCNRAKFTFSVKDFLEYIDKIYVYQHELS